MSNKRTVSFMKRLLENYDNIRGKDKSLLGVPYWDAVVLTAVDEQQRALYMTQIKYKMAKNELPLGLPIHVVADPPGPKIGTGGATLTALTFLKTTYGDNLYNQRILLIHAGGQSQRMPSSSIMGKVFSPIPHAKHLYQLLDIKLATFTPLIAKMCPGVFVTCADEFLVYNLESDHEDVSFTFATTGFTALAHPAPASVCTLHGAYIISDKESIDTLSLVQEREGVEVVEKVSLQSAYEKGAVLASAGLKFPDGIEVDGPAVYTNSSYLFSHDITERFLQFQATHGPIDCEIDAYADFLQALGTKATPQYMQNTGHISNVTASVTKTRKAVFDLLKGTPVKVLLMNSSKYVHIGTTKEYIHHFCSNDTFQLEMGLSKDAFNLWLDTSYRSDNDQPCQEYGNTKDINRMVSDDSPGCVMHSILPKQSVISSTAVVEYCRFLIPVSIGRNVIINNCEYSNDGRPDQTTGLTIPNDLFIHTIPVELQEKATYKYVTVYFDINDNLKKTADNASDVGKLPFLGTTIKHYIEALDVNTETIEEGTQEQGSKANLWFANLFPVSDSMTESLGLAIHCIDAARKGNRIVMSLWNFKFISMATILKKKNVLTMLDWRSKLCKCIVDKVQ